MVVWKQKKIHKKIRKIIIEPLEHGFIVNVGCNSFAIEQKRKLIEKLTMYINNPNETEEKWFNEKTL